MDITKTRKLGKIIAENFSFKKGKINIYSSKKIKSKICGVLDNSKGKIGVKIDEVTGTWVKVQLPKYASYYRPTPTDCSGGMFVPFESVSLRLKVTPMNIIGRIKGTGTRVRSLYTTDSQIVYFPPKGAKMRILGAYNHGSKAKLDIWYQVALPEKRKGWLWSGLIDLTDEKTSDILAIKNVMNKAKPKATQKFLEGK